MAASQKDQTQLQDLPNELLSQILASLSLKDELSNAQQVCQRWHAVVDETIGKEVVISTMNSDWSCSDSELMLPPPLGNYGLDVISKVGVKTCYVEVTKWKGDDENDDLVSLHQVKFKYPFLLRNLHFNGGMRSTVFKSLLSDVNNLTKLELNMLSLSQLQPSELKHLRLSRLRSLGVRKCVKSSCKHFDDTLGLGNLQVFLSYNKFPLLAHLDLRFPVAHFKDFKTVATVVNFLGFHCKLKELCLLVEYPVEVTPFKNYEAELGNILQTIRNHPNHSSLKVVEVQGIRLHGSYPQSQIWIEFAQQQRTLKSLTLRLGAVHATKLEAICRHNVSTLEDIYLYKLSENGEDPQKVTLDCTAFKEMKRLQILYALGADLVTNACKLPLTLCTLFITGCMKSEEAEFILFGLPCLHFCSLRDVYNQTEGYGISLELLRKFIEARRVKRLILNGSSLCDEFPIAGILNGDPDTQMYLSVIENWDPTNTFLDWELNCDKYYINKFY